MSSSTAWARRSLLCLASNFALFACVRSADGVHVAVRATLCCARCAPLCALRSTLRAAQNLNSYELLRNGVCAEAVTWGTNTGATFQKHHPQGSLLPHPLDPELPNTVPRANIANRALQSATQRGGNPECAVVLAATFGATGLIYQAKEASKGWNGPGSGRAALVPEVETWVRDLVDAMVQIKYCPLTEASLPLLLEEMRKPDMGKLPLAPCYTPGALSNSERRAELQLVSFWSPRVQWHCHIVAAAAHALLKPGAAGAAVFALAQGDGGGVRNMSRKRARAGTAGRPGTSAASAITLWCVRDIVI